MHAITLALAHHPTLAPPQVRVVSEDTEEDVPTGQVGEVVCRGPTVFTGYEGAPGATAEAFAAGGWFRTGDLAQRLEGGALVVVDRKKDMVGRRRDMGR